MTGGRLRKTIFGRKGIAVQGRIFRPRALVFVFLILAVLMVSSALIELHQSKKELLDLMHQDAHNLLGTLLISSQNTLMTNEYLESFLEERLLNNANFIRYLYEHDLISDAFLEKFARENNIFRINIFSRDGRRIYSNHKPIIEDVGPQFMAMEFLRPIFSGEQDTLIIGLRKAQFEPGFRYAVAIAAKNRSAIVLNLNADDLLRFRRQIGFGVLLRNIAQNRGVVYTALQDTSGILAASGNVTELERIVDSTFLYHAYRDSVFATRITPFNGQQVFEAVHPFYYRGISVGLFRIGLSLEALQAINQRIYRRIAVISIVLLFLGSIMFSFLLVRQNLDLLQRQYEVVESYSSNLIQSVSDAIIVLDAGGNIKVFNHAAESLFGKKESELIGKPFSVLFEDRICSDILQSPSSMKEIECSINGKKKVFLISRSTFRDEHGTANTVLVIRDLTEQKRLEEQIQRKERLSAMGELASGVAHEIRNPLNTIGMIVQQIDKDFEPAQNTEEYHNLLQLVYREVRRINETVQDFLRFARPEPVRPSTFRLAELLAQLEQQYAPLFREKNCQLRIAANWDGEVRWDRNQIQQVFMNLLQNAIDVLGEGGYTEVRVQAIGEDEIEIVVQDNGPGIPEQIRAKIFNLYFTTKAKGTGIGLSIVQRIVYEHGGVISVESADGKGTIFTIRLPRRVS